MNIESARSLALRNKAGFCLDLHANVSPDGVKVSDHVELVVFDHLQIDLGFRSARFYALCPEQFASKGKRGFPVEVLSNLAAESLFGRQGHAPFGIREKGDFGGVFGQGGPYGVSHMPLRHGAGFNAHEIFDERSKKGCGTSAAPVFPPVRPYSRTKAPLPYKPVCD